MEIVKGQIYKHTKSTNLYKIIAIGKHSETLEDLVVYQALYDNKVSKIWIRPVYMFLEMIELNGQKFSRFQLVNE